MRGPDGYERKGEILKESKNGKTAVSKNSFRKGGLALATASERDTLWNMGTQDQTIVESQLGFQEGKEESPLMPLKHKSGKTIGECLILP